jgi:hypothetical protein
MRHLLPEIIAISGRAKHGHHTRDTREYRRLRSLRFSVAPLAEWEHLNRSLTVVIAAQLCALATRFRIAMILAVVVRSRAIDQR